jgi:endonuclease YncB( thermonuclease family)
MISNDDLFWYKAKYLSNYDGDTVDVTMDLGFRIGMFMRIRLIGINCPEMIGKTKVAGTNARDFLKVLLVAGGQDHLRVKSFRDESDKYGGRWLGELWMPVLYNSEGSVKTAHFAKDGPWTNLNQLMVDCGHAVPYKP